MPKAKNSRWGGANPTNVGPTGKVVTQRPGTTTKHGEAKVQVVTSGAGPYVVDVQYHPGTGKVLVTRGDINSDSIDGPRIAKVMHPIVYTDPTAVLPELDKWFPTLPSGEIDWPNSPLLPDDFEHVDGFPTTSPPVSNLPAGIGFVRLLPGSSPLGMSRWDADLEDFGSTGAASADRRPVAVKAVIRERESGDATQKVHSTIDIFFSCAISLRYAQYGTEYARRIQVQSNKGPIKVSTATIGSEANILRVTCLRPITRDETVYVKVLDGIVVSGSVSNVASEVLTAVELLPKNCYALVINRSGGKDLAVGDYVQLGKPVTIIDTVDKVPYQVYECMPYGSGGGINLYYGMVLGGNPLLSGSTVRQFINPVPMFNEDKSALVVSPIPEDWGNLDLPVDWDVEDSFTEDQETPLGLGYVQLLRPSEWGGKSWTSAYALPVNPGGWSDTEDVPTVIASIYKNTASLEIFWSHGAVAVLPAQVRSKILITSVATPPDGTPPLAPLSILSAVASAGKIVVTLNRVIATYEIVTVSVLSNLWKTGATPPLVNMDQTVTASRAVPLGAVVMAVSKVSLQGFVMGDFVVMADLGTTVTDENDVSRPVLDILYPINPQRLPHSHQTYGNGPIGGGPANLNFAGTVNLGATA